MPRTSSWKTGVDPLSRHQQSHQALRRSALGRLSREGALTSDEHSLAKADLDEDWPRYLAIEVSGAVWRAAGNLAEKHALRGFDSLHLASFLYLVDEGLGEPVQFSSFDGRLNGAAQAETAARTL